MINEETKHIVFEEEYASDNAELRKLLYSFDTNKIAIKKSTGYGFTHAMCNYTRGNLIILSPNNSMIEDKSQKEGKEETLEKPKKKYDCKKFYSICDEDQGYKFKDLLYYLQTTPAFRQNVVVNLNAEWLINANSNHELWELLRGFNVFIDEKIIYEEPILKNLLDKKDLLDKLTNIDKIDLTLERILNEYDKTA